MRSMSSRFDTSQTTVFSPGISFAAVSSAFSSMSQTQTFAPIAAKALAISLPMPDAPAVTSTRCAIFIAPVLPARLRHFTGSARIATQAGPLSVSTTGFFMPPATATYWTPSSM